MSESHEHPHHDPKLIPIEIDHKPYKVPSDKNPVTGKYLRDLPEPAVSNDYDLWLRLPGDDEVVEPEDTIRLEPGMYFYTAKKELTPGAVYAAAR
jgi:hypothetical protein